MSTELSQELSSLSTISTSSQSTMTSKEVAELTDRRHDNVLRDIDNLLKTLSSELRTGFSMTYEGDPAHGYRYYIMDRDSTFCLVAGYDANARMKIIKRWQELEAQQAQQAQQAKPEVKTFATTEDLASHILEVRLKVGALFKVPEHFAQAEAVKAVVTQTGIDYSGYLSASPAQDNILPQHELLEPNDLASRFGLTYRTGTPDGGAINRLLHKHGYQKKEYDSWVPTEEGKPYCQRHHWTKGTKTGYNYKWSVPLVEHLLGLEA